MNPNTHFQFSTEQITNALRAVGVICLGVLTLLLVAKTVNEVKSYSTIGTDGVSSAQYGTITVSGHSETFVKPDITKFTVDITSEGKTADDASNQAATIENKVLAFLKSNGVQENDIKTLNYYTTEKYGNKYTPCVNPGVKPMQSMGVVSEIAPMPPQPCGTSESVTTGYITSESIEVKVRDIKNDAKKTGTLIAGVTSLGAKASNPISSIDDSDQFQNKVREEAIMKARQRANILANQLGVKLVRITTFNENQGYPYPIMYGAMAMDARMEKSTAPELPTGSNKVSSDVTLTYEIR
jgi:uncharacterized protein YggE